MPSANSVNAPQLEYGERLDDNTPLALIRRAGAVQVSNVQRCMQWTLSYGHSLPVTSSCIVDSVITFISGPTKSVQFIYFFCR